MSHTADLSSPSLYSLYNLKIIGNRNKNRQSSFYLSFEDALWDLISRTSFETFDVLLPSFFCPDVSLRIAERGFKITHYTLDKNLRINTQLFTETTKNKKYAFAIIYYPMGMVDGIPNVRWFRDILGKSTLLIEDYADCIVDENEICLIDDNHIAIDSIRKVLPIQGARIWGKNYIQQNNNLSLSYYALKSLLMWNLTRLMGLIYHIINFNWVDNLRWNFFSKHSDLIGSSKYASKGFGVDRYILDFINVGKYKLQRAITIKNYLESFSQFSFEDPWGPIEIAPIDVKNVRFVIFRGPKNELSKLSGILEKEGISTDTHFDDSPLGQHYDFLLLPSGFKVNKVITDKIALMCFNFYKTHI